MSRDDIKVFDTTIHTGGMKNNTNDNSACPYTRKGYSSAEHDSALELASFLFDLWYVRLENEIMKVDKTIYDNEEPTNIV